MNYSMVFNKFSPQRILIKALWMYRSEMSFDVIQLGMKQLDYVETFCKSSEKLPRRFY